MAFKLVFLLASLTYVSAGLYGAPAISTYAAAPALSYHAPAIAAPAAYAYQTSAPAAYAYQRPAPAAYAYQTAAPSAYAYQTPALTSQSSNIYRSYGNLGQVSTYSKTIDTPFSSVSKSDVRVSNPGLRIAAPQAALAHAPLLGVAYSAAPAVSHINYVSGYANYAF